MFNNQAYHMLPISSVSMLASDVAIARSFVTIDYSDIWNRVLD